MRRGIDLLNVTYPVTVFGRCGERRLQVGDGPAQPVGQVDGADGAVVVELGPQRADMQVAVSGETAYIRAFERTFALHVLDPVEQAAQEAGGRGNTARAPMPGMVVEVRAAPGEHVSRGQPLMTIESMKILTVIVASRSGEVARIHFQPGQTFEKNAVLVTLESEQES